MEKEREKELKENKETKYMLRQRLKDFKHDSSDCLTELWDTNIAPQSDVHRDMLLLADKW